MSQLNDVTPSLSIIPVITNLTKYTSLIYCVRIVLKISLVLRSVKHILLLFYNISVVTHRSIDYLLSVS